MIIEGIHINGLYQHYKGGYYKVVQVAHFHDNELPAIVVYQKSDKDGLFKSIRLDNGDIIKQPFYRFVDDFKKEVSSPAFQGHTVPRFKFIKQL